MGTHQGRTCCHARDERQNKGRQEKPLEQYLVWTRTTTQGLSGEFQLPVMSIRGLQHYLLVVHQIDPTRHLDLVVHSIPVHLRWCLLDLLVLLVSLELVHLHVHEHPHLTCPKKPRLLVHHCHRLARVRSTDQHRCRHWFLGRSLPNDPSSSFENLVPRYGSRTLRKDDEDP